MNKRLLLGALVAFLVIFNLGYVFHEFVAADYLKAGFGPGVQRTSYVIPVIFLAFVLYVALMALAFPVAHLFFVERRGWSKLATGALLGAYCGFLWDALQGGIIEYATYNVALAAMLVDSSYHLAEGVLCGVIIAAFYRG
ncbi:MAG TPA: hypothetical protein VJT73_17675 [Polyangiaceae bacterium]|nr:hypothetical protein [Polyangiaceae bacterium]